MRRGWFLPIAAALGFSFLYAPIVSLVVFSFNESRLVTVWSGFSTKWYGELFSDPQLLGAAWLSLQIAALSASIALVLGTLAAVALVRDPAFRLELLGAVARAMGEDGLDESAYAWIEREARPEERDHLRRRVIEGMKQFIYEVSKPKTQGESRPTP